MRHARDDDLDQLEPLLAELRELPPLREKKRGTFYRGSRAFLHFRADPSGLYADVRFHEEFERVRVTTGKEQRGLMARIEVALR